MLRGKHMAKQLDCTTNIASTQNNGIHGILFGPHMTFSWLCRLDSKRKPGLVNISGVDWTPSKWNHSNQQMPYERSSLNWISGSAMIVGLKMSHISSAHYTTGMYSNVSRSFWHISHFRRSWILNWCASLSLRVIESTARWTWVSGGEMHRINFLPERRLWQVDVHPTRLTEPIVRATIMPGHCMSQLVIFDKISAAQLKTRRNTSWAVPMSPERCQKHWPSMAFRGWNCAVST